MRVFFMQVSYTKTMKLRLITIGKKDEDKYASAIADFTSRTQHYFDTTWKILSSAKNTSAPVDMQKSKST
jgi:23S rRNA pseudoU1915 N3-methylase RlmH